MEDQPADDEKTSVRINFHQQKVVNFHLFKHHLESEMRLCGDETVREGGSNENILNTIDQMVDAEEKVQNSVKLINQLYS